MLVVRAAQTEDANEIAGVHVRSWQVAYRGLMSDAYLDGLRPEDRVAHYTLDSTEPGRPATIVAIAGSTIRGFATIGASRSDRSGDEGELYALYVDPTHWGHGVGRLLMEEARARLSGQGYGEAILWVLVRNQHAIRFYDADGWQPDGHRRQEEVYGVLANMIRFRRKLP
jgi:GNAT superfamily N-acetyltransferase